MRYIALMLLAPLFSLAQNNTQSIRGTVTDKLTQTPLIGVVVQIGSLERGIATDTLGTYTLSNLPPERYEVKITYVGYKTITIPNVVVTSGKEVILDIAMEEAFTTLNEVTVVAHNKEGTINKLTSVSARSFSMEEVNRYAGGRSDPARLAANFAGVNAPDDSRNDIVIRGNSPVGVLWRIDGMNVNNPNHFASVGTTGGAVSAINTNLLKNSDFFTSAFPAEYGNAISGVFDLGFRSGNNQKRETTMQAGVITGLELTTEGPFKKVSDASYLVGYRYSLAGIAQAAGIDIGTTATPSYQDLSFKLTGGSKKLGRFSMFGVLASSTINIGGGSSNTLYGNGNKVDFGSKIGIAGINHFKAINAKSFLATTLGVNFASTDQTTYDFDRRADSTYTREVSEVAKTTYSLSSAYNWKINSRLFFKAGLQHELIGLDLYYKTKDNIYAPEKQVWDYQSSTQLLQAFTHFKYSINSKLILNAGLHGQYFVLNESKSIEPRFGLVYQASEKSSFNVGVGLHSQLQPLNVYFLQSTMPDGSINYNNKQLDFTRSKHYVFGYNIQPSAEWRVKTELYYQSLYDVPVTSSTSSYSMLNTGATFKTDLTDSLINGGTGINYGAELTLERFFSKSYYGLFTASVYSSKYKGSDGIEHNTAFNGKFVYNLLAGKEWKLGSEKRNRFSLDVKYTHAGGRSYTPIDLSASTSSGHEVLSSEVYSEQYENYYRADVKAGFTLNSARHKVAQTISLDLQNISNHKNVFSQNYDNRNQKINSTYQLGFFPNVMYKLQF